MIQGYHGTGQIDPYRAGGGAAQTGLHPGQSRQPHQPHRPRRKDAIVLRGRHAGDEFREGLLPWAIQHPVSLVFDEYDAGRPDVMFVIQRVLEVEGKLTWLDQNRVIRPHPYFRLFSTTNTVGLGDTTGLYHGTQQINQGPDGPLETSSRLELPAARGRESRFVLAKAPSFDNEGRPPRDPGDGGAGRAHALGLHQRRHLHRHVAEDVITWAENMRIFNDVAFAFRLSPSSTSATRSSAPRWPNTTSAASAPAEGDPASAS